MKLANTILIILGLSSLPALAAKKRTRNLADGQAFTHYAKREKAELKVALVYYGRYWKNEDLLRIAPLLKERFLKATEGEVGLDIRYTETLDYKHKIEDYPDYSNNGITDKSRLQRLWYHDNKGGKVLAEAYEEFKKTELGRKNYKDLDALLVVSGAQYNALGFASGRVAITEQPMEVAWALPDGGRVAYISDEGVVDELVHELGHLMFLGHTSTQCMDPSLTLKEREICCEASPAKNDVMSYCRKRGAVDEDFFHKFESCNMNMIKKLVKPAMLRGASRKVRGRDRCK